MSITRDVMTADELLQMSDDGYRYELVKGELHRMAPAGSEHGKVALKIGSRLLQHVEAHDLGVVFGAETGFKIAADPDTVRAPDVAFVRGDRIPETGFPKGYWPGAPDLAVEVISPGDIYGEVEEKVDQWLDAGTRMVIVANPRNYTLKVYRSHLDITILGRADKLTLNDVVPGFACDVADLFS